MMLYMATEMWMPCVRVACSAHRASTVDFGMTQVRSPRDIHHPPVRLDMLLIRHKVPCPGPGMPRQTRRFASPRLLILLPGAQVHDSAPVVVHQARDVDHAASVVLHAASHVDALCSFEVHDVAVHVPYPAAATLRLSVAGCQHGEEDELSGGCRFAETEIRAEICWNVSVVENMMVWQI